MMRLAVSLLSAFASISIASATALQSDNSFSIGTGADSTVYDINADASGSVWVAGDFSTINSISRAGVAKLSSTGTVDPAFAPPSDMNSPRIVVPLSDGKVLVGCYSAGTSTTYRRGLVRLNTNGSIDTTFDAGATTDYYVYALEVQASGKILVAGYFTKGIARLNADGSNDSTFNPGTGSSGSIYTIQSLPSGKILVGGSFSTFNGVSRSNFCRLEANGTLDAGFGSAGSGAGSTVYDIKKLPDGQIMIGGSFSSINSSSRSYLARLSENGVVDPFFIPTINSTVYSICPLADGRVFVGGDFSNVDSLTRQRIALLYADGKADTTFDSTSGASSTVRVIRRATDGNFLIGGSFSTVATVSSKYVAKIVGPGSATRAAGGNLSPLWADAGTQLQLKGSNLSNLTAIQFAGNVPATFTPVSDTEVTVTVPAGASSGALTLKSSFGDAATPFAFYPFPFKAGTFDPTFNVGNGASSSVYALASDSLGRIFIAGDFSSINGVSRTGIARLNPDGSVDTSFTPPSSSSPRCIAVQSDGKILVGGYSIGGKAGIARLNADGTLDTSFDASSVAGSYVYAIAVQTDGKILIGGSFTRRIARLNPNGTQDLTFETGTGASSQVSALRIQPDGKVLMGGDFTTYNGFAAKYLTRLNANGSIDSTFQVTGTGISGSVKTLALQADGSIIVGGSYSSINGNSAYKYLARLRPGGALDGTFQPTPNDYVNDLEILPDGRIAVGGEFSAIGGLSRNYAALLHADGAMVTAFNTTGGPSSDVYTILPTADGKLIIGGSFSTVGGQAIARIARLAGDAGQTRPAISSITPESGAPGDSITLNGSNLGSLTRAEFGGGIVASITPVSESVTKVDVPPGAMSGPIILQNAYGASGSLPIFKLLSKPTPVITGIPAGDVVIGGTFTVTGKNFYDVTSVRVGVLTAVFNVDSATSMTVTVPANALTSRVILTGPGGTVQSTTDLSVVKAPPAFTSATTATGMVGQNFSFSILASNNPTNYTAAPLPSGLSLNAATGLISGTPTADGVTAAAVTATNGGGTANGSLTITISPPLPPVVTSVTPSDVAPGGKIIISGDYLLQTTAITVGGVATTFEILSDDRILVIMPPGVISGTVAVTTQQGSVTSAGSVKQWNFQAGSQIVTAFGDNSSGESTPTPGLSDVTSVAAGQFHSLALRADGSVTGWGANWAGQTTPPAGLTAVAISAGGFHSLAIQPDETIAAWGRNDEGQCSGASGISDAMAISTGSFHSLALTRFGMVKAWGSDSNGQSTVPANLGGVVAIAAGANFSVALKSDGSVVAWGDNSSGQTTVPATATGIVAITAGTSHVSALKSDGTVISWGANWTGQSTVPTGLNQVTGISAGANHTIALKADGSCVAWGANWSGQSDEPITTDAVMVAAGGDHCLILHAASAIPNVTLPLIANGKPGVAFNLTPGIQNDPVTFSASGLPTGLSIAPTTGVVSGTPTRGGDSLVTITARNGFGISRYNVRFFVGPYVIGWGTSVPSAIPPSLSNVVQVAAGADHCLALLNDGTVSAWGNNNYGQTTIPSGLTGIVAVAAGQYFSLALKSNGFVYAWGKNPSYSYNSPWTTAPIATNVVAIDANGLAGTALTSSGTSQTIVGQYPITLGSELISIATRSANYGYSPFDQAIAINRDGYITAYLSSSIPSTSGFDRVVASRGSSSYSSDSSPLWGIRTDGGFYEVQYSRYSSGSALISRPEATNALDVAAGTNFALALKSDGSVTTLQPSPDPDYPSYLPSPPLLATDSLVNVGAIAAQDTYALAVKDPVVRARFTSPRVLQGRTGVLFSHQPATSAPALSYGAILLPAGLTISASTGLISGTPTGKGVFNFLITARYATYFTTQVVSAKFTQGVAPVDITLTGGIVAENLPTDSPVGTLATMDYSPSDTFTYALAAGPGSTDNSKFKISGNQLLTSGPLDFETKSQMSVRVQVTDSGRNTFAKVFTITVTNVFTDDDDLDGLTQAEESQLGTDPRLRDTDQDGASDGQEIAAGTNPLSAASKPSNYVAAWGQNDYGQCNIPNNLGPVVAVAAGDYHTLALKADGTVAAWGYNSDGQCDVPAGLHNVVAIAAGSYHSVALMADGTVVAWGTTSYDLDTIPAGLTNVVEISASNYTTAALKADGQVVVWGSTSYDTNTVPAAAQGSVHIAVGSGSVLALTKNGNTIGWGDDWQGKISGPSGSKDLIALAGGNYLSLALTEDGSVRAWGWDIYDETTVPADLGSVASLSASYYNGLATGTDGSLHVWGYSGHQQTTVPAGLGPVQMAVGGYGHVVALVGSAPPEYFATSSIKAVVGLPVHQQLSFIGTADRFTAMSLPPGLSFDTSNGSITGAPTQSGRFDVRFTAEKGFSRITRIIPITCGNPRRFDEWSAVHFNGPPVDPLSDPDGDSVSNLLEYALHRNPTGQDSGPPVVQTTVQSGGQNYLALSYERLKEASDLSYLVEVSDDLVTWTSGNPSTATVSITNHTDTDTVTVRDTVPSSGTTHRFIRLKVEKNPGS